MGYQQIFPHKPGIASVQFVLWSINPIYCWLHPVNQTSNGQKITQKNPNREVTFSQSERKKPPWIVDFPTCSYTGWFGTFNLFFHILGIVTPTDQYFSEG